MPDPASSKTNCSCCHAEIQPKTAEYHSGLCSPCSGIVGAIAWRRSKLFFWLNLMLPFFALTFGLWLLSLQRDRRLLFALIPLLLIFIHNLRLRTSTKPPPC